MLDAPAEQGFAGLEFELDETIEPFRGELSVDGQPVAELKSVDDLTLDTTAFTDGEHRVSLGLTDSDGVLHVGWTTFEIRNPGARLTGYRAPETVYPGMQVEIEVTTEGSVSDIAADFSQLVPGFDPADLRVTLGHPSRVTYRLPMDLVMEEDWYQIPINVTDHDGRTYLFDAYEVFLASGPLLPLTSEKGVVERTSMPASDDPDSLIEVVGLRLEGSVVPGGRLKGVVELAGDLEDGELLLSVQGYGGHLAIPIESLTPVGRNPGDMEFEADLADDPNADEGDLVVDAAASDRDGKAGGMASGGTRKVVPMEGDLTVTLKWDPNIEADMDIHILEPDGEEVYWGSSHSDDSGVLDIDSNTHCNYDGINREVVVWPRPPSGEYIVKVDYYMDCDTSGPFGYEIQIEGCESDGQTITGTITAGMEPDHGSAGSGTEVVRFTCLGTYSKVSGTVEYEHLDWKAVGEVTKVSKLEGVKVGVFDALEQTPKRIGDWSTVGPDGRFEFQFPYDPQSDSPEVYLMFRADGEDAFVKDPSTGAVHSYRAGMDWRPADEPDHEMDVLIPLDDAGPFHIYSTISKARQYYTRKFPRYSTELSKTEVRWPAIGTAFKADPSDPDKDHIKLMHKGGDMDEFDDPVILHEFGHRIMKRMSVDDSTGNRDEANVSKRYDHKLMQQLHPEFAWSEGMATFLGQVVLDTSKHCDRSGDTNRCHRINNMTRLRGAGLLATANRHHREGRLSEWMVSGVMWDMFDKAAGDSDPIQVTAKNLLNDVFTTMKDSSDLLKGAVVVDGGVEVGKADLADFIYHWACSRSDKRKGQVDTLLDSSYNLQWIANEDFCPLDTHPVIDSVGPGEAISGDPMIFTILGDKLTGEDGSRVGIWIPGCLDMKHIEPGSSAQQQYQCDPVLGHGEVGAWITYRDDIRSSIIYDFTVKISD